MLSRRHARSKVLQSLYAFKLSSNDQLYLGEKELKHSIEKLFDMFYNQLDLIFKIKDVAFQQLEDAKFKKVPSAEDLNPNMRFVNNTFLLELEENLNLKSILKTRKSSWHIETDIPKRIFRKFKSSAVFKSYMTDPNQNFDSDKAIILKLIKKYIFTHRPLFDFYEDGSIYWTNDFDFATFVLIKMIQDITSDNVRHYNFYDTSDEDILEVINFSKDLFRKTQTHSQRFSDIIASYTQNWEIERVALMDNLIMQLALCELYEFPSIPIKVTLNEYIELAKKFSTQKSNIFINGVLDKIVEDGQKSKLFSKTGRGLIEN